MSAGVFTLVIVREAGAPRGLPPLTGTFLPFALQVVQVPARDLHDAFRRSPLYQTLAFRGQLRRVFTADGTELFYDGFEQGA